jgi:hypothetical protein
MSIATAGQKEFYDVECDFVKKVYDVNLLKELAIRQSEQTGNEVKSEEMKQSLGERCDNEGVNIGLAEADEILYVLMGTRMALEYASSDDFNNNEFVESIKQRIESGIAMICECIELPDPSWKNAYGHMPHHYSSR